jgi:hypothetical protein
LTGAAPSDSPDVMSASARGEAAALIGTSWHVLSRSVSRTDFRNLPLRNILVPTLSGPMLHFSERDLARGNVLSAWLDELRPRYFRALDRTRRIEIARRARAMHLTRVSLADGFTWPELPYCWFLFEGEPDPYE